MMEYQSNHFGESIDDAADKRHTHGNKPTLDSFGDSLGRVTFDGRVIKMYPVIYRADLSTPGSEIIIPLSLDGGADVQIYLRYKYSSATEISASIRSAHTSNLVDVKRSTQWGLVGVEGSSIDNMLIASAYQSIDLIVYNESLEMHRIWVRFKDRLNDVWSVYEINCFCSASARRTDVWVTPIYQAYTSEW